MKQKIESNLTLRNKGIQVYTAKLNNKLVYVINESIDPVYFDNLMVKLDHSQIIEENHYYAFGLKIGWFEQINQFKSQLKSQQK